MARAKGVRVKGSGARGVLESPLYAATVFVVVVKIVASHTTVTLRCRIVIHPTGSGIVSAGKHLLKLSVAPERMRKTSPQSGRRIWQEMFVTGILEVFARILHFLSILPTRRDCFLANLSALVSQMGGGVNVRHSSGRPACEGGPRRGGDRRCDL